MSSNEKLAEDHPGLVNLLVGIMEQANTVSPEMKAKRARLLKILQEQHAEIDVPPKPQ